MKKMLLKVYTMRHSTMKSIVSLIIGDKFLQVKYFVDSVTAVLNLIGICSDKKYINYVSKQTRIRTYDIIINFC